MKAVREFRSDMFYVRAVDESDREYMRSVAAAEYLFGRLYSVEPDIGLKVYWEEIVTDIEDQNYVAFLSNGELLGRIALQGVESDIPELAIVIVKEHQSQGYGYLLLKQWLNWIYEECGLSCVTVKIDSENKKSIALFRKLGVDIDHEADIIYGHLCLPIS